MSCSKCIFRYPSKRHIIQIFLIVLFFLSFASVTVFANSQIFTRAVMEDQVTPISGGEGGTTESTVQNIVSTVYNIITHKIYFPTATLKDALVNVFNDMIKGGTDDLKGSLSNVVRNALNWLYGADVTRNVKLELWKVLLAVASALMPLSLIMTVGSAMREGVSSVTGYAAAREAITHWIISVALAGGSFYIISLFTDVSSAVSYQIMKQSLNGFKVDPSALFVNAILGMAILSKAGPLGRLFISLLALFACIAVVTSVVIVVFAREVILLLLTVIAPVVFILAPLEQTRWLSGLWTKAFTFTLLLGPINVILISAGGLLYNHGINSVGAGSLIGMIIAIGVVSIMITLNQAVGQLIYGAAMEIANKAVGTMTGIVQAAITAVGFATGFGAIGAAAGSLVGNQANTLTSGGAGITPVGDGGESGIQPSNSGGTGPSLGKRPGITSHKSDDTGDMKEIFGRQRQVSNDISKVGGALANSGIPGLSSFGAGMSASGAIGEMKALNGLNEANRISANKNQMDFNPSPQMIGQAVTQAQTELPDLYSSVKTPPSTENLDLGIQHGTAGLMAYQEVGGDMTDYLAMTTGFNPGTGQDGFVEAASTMIKADATQYLGYSSVNHRGILQSSGDNPVDYTWNRSDKGVTPNDVRFAMEAVRKFDNIHAGDPMFIAGVASGASVGRQAGNFSYERMMKDMSNQHLGRLDNWALNTATRFPNGPKPGSIDINSSDAMTKLTEFYKNKRNG